jgi:hypothetical protein
LDENAVAPWCPLEATASTRAAISDSPECQIQNRRGDFLMHRDRPDSLYKYGIVYMIA